MEEEKKESMLLRNLSFATLLLAGILMLWRSSDVQPPEQQLEKLKHEQIDFTFRALVSQSVSLKTNPQYAAQAGDLVGEVQSLCSEMKDSPYAQLQCAMLLEYLGEDFSGRVGVQGKLEEQFTDLYVNAKPISDQSEIFKVPAGRLALLKQYELLGQAANKDELVEQLQSEALEFQAWAVLFIAGAVFAILLGILFVTLAVLKKPVPHFGFTVLGLPRGHLRVLLEATILYFFMIAALLPILGRYIPDFYHMTYLAVSYVLLLIGVLVYVQQQTSGAALYAIIGDLRTSSLRQIGIGIMGFCAIFPLGLLTAMPFLLTLQGDNMVNQAHPIAFLSKEHFFMVAILAAVIAPVIEEVVFRGFLYGFLRGYLSPVMAATVNGFLFAVIHPQGAAALPHLFILGTGLCLLREYNRSLLPSIVVHMVSNGLLMVGMYFLKGF